MEFTFQFKATGRPKGQRKRYDWQVKSFGDEKWARLKRSKVSEQGSGKILRLHFQGAWGEVLRGSPNFWAGTGERSGWARRVMWLEMGSWGKHTEALVWVWERVKQFALLGTGGERNPGFRDWGGCRNVNWFWECALTASKLGLELGSSTHYVCDLESFHFSWNERLSVFAF